MSKAFDWFYRPPAIRSICVLLTVLSSPANAQNQTMAAIDPAFDPMHTREVRGKEKGGLPNIILMVADDLGYGDFSCYGATRIITSRIDSLASEGMMFTNAYVASSLCSPSRYSILTGRYSWRTHLKKGVLTSFARPLIEENRITLGSMLKKAGYYTVCIGKWHLGFNWQLKEPAPAGAEELVFNSWGTGTQDYIDFSKPVQGGPVETGFDYFFGIPGSNNMIPFVFIENEKVIDPPSIPNNFGPKTLRAPNWDLRSLDQKLTQKAIGMIDKHFQKNSADPLFLYFPASAIHQPCLPAETKGLSRAGLRGDMILEFDRMVGEVVGTLRKHDALSNTLIIITSDNGPLPGDPFALTEKFRNHAFGKAFDYYQSYFGEYKPDHSGNSGQEKGWLVYGHDPAAGLQGFKSDAWEGGLRVPFIVYWPGKVKKGTVNTNVICTVDLFATLADVTGKEPEGKEGEDSYSFLQNLINPDAPQVRRSLTIIAGRSGAMVVRQGKWKYIEAAVRDRSLQPASYPPPPNEYPDVSSVYEPQLYQLDADPVEKYNLVKKMPGKAMELKNTLEKVKTTIKSEDE